MHFDLHNVPLESNQFDVIFCNHVLEHVEDANRCMKELYRMMKPGGWGIFQVPQDFNLEVTLEDPSITDPKEREKVFWQKDHVRLFGKDYPKWLERAGFNVTVFDPQQHFSVEDIEKYRLMPKELLYIANKAIA
jgi:ubiquinone/menaquinone biosynthesis C-methylase UbiE